MSENKELFTTIREEAHVEFEEKRSIFLGHALRTDSEEEAQAFVKKLKKQYADATHNVFAYLMRGEAIARYSDDGEPQGTAGMPVLDVIRKSGVRSVTVVVTRYFGGTLLGAGGLVRAYSHAASLAIEAGGIITYAPYTEYELRCGYSEYGKYQVVLAAAGAVIDSTDFAADVCIRYAIRATEGDALCKKILEIGYGKDVPQNVGTRFDYR